MPTLLIIHIIGAVGLFALFAATILAVVKKFTSSYKTFFYSIAGMNIVQLVTGGMLFISATNTMSGTQFCAELSIYVILSLIFEVILYTQIRNESQASNFATLSRKK